MSEASQSEGGVALGDVAGAAGIAIVLILAWVYVAGWTYAYYYFDLFRIPLLLVDPPREHLLVYGGLTLWKNPLWSGIGALVTLVLAGIFASRRWLGRVWLTLFTLAGVLALSALFLLVRPAGEQTAAADFAAQRASDYGAYPRVDVVLKNPPAADVDQADPLAIAASGCARLLLSNSQRLFLIRPVAGAPGLDLHTFVLSWGDVAALRITDRYTSCD